MKRPLDPSGLEALGYVDGLVPVIAQDRATGAVLMLAWANREALEQSMQTGAMTYWSRSRGELWEKGATSGHKQRLVSLAVDCDGDAVLAIVDQDGPACHEGSATCWQETASAGALGIVDQVAAARQKGPQGRYTDKLLAEPHLAAAKVVEEAEEVAMVLRGHENPDSLEHEAADLLYHLTVALRAGGSDLQSALRELLTRHA